MQRACLDARCVFPNLLYGEEAAFEASTYLDTRGDKHRTVRGAWQPFFFSDRCAALILTAPCFRQLQPPDSPASPGCSRLCADLCLRKAALQSIPSCNLLPLAACASSRPQVEISNSDSSDTLSQGRALSLSVITLLLCDLMVTPRILVPTPALRCNFGPA